MTRIIVTGSRDWPDVRTIEIAISAEAAEAGDSVTIVHGACPSGADAIADRYARRCGFLVERHPAEWAKYGKSAGFRRNAEMVDAGADVCLAFIRNCSRGATHCASLAKRAGIFVHRVSIDDAP